MAPGIVLMARKDDVAPTGSSGAQLSRHIPGYRVIAEPCYLRPMHIEFLGAAGTVTGSMHLLTTDSGKRVLLDCGLFQGRRQEAYEINSKLPFNPSELDAVVLSHAHIDHSGNLPSLVKGDRKDRFHGSIHATHATRDLCGIMLPDSAHIQESDFSFMRRHDRPVREPIYDSDDAARALGRFVTHSYQETFDVVEGVRATYFDAGHILGSALVVLDIDRASGGTTRLCFTGDLGRPDRPILRDPQPVGDVDYLISESTYGGRTHPTYGDLMEELRTTIIKTIERRGKVIIPAFAVGRTQDIVYLLNVLFENGELPRVPMYVDSPLAISATDIFRTHLDCFNDDVRRLLETDPDPFGFDTLHFVRSADESKALNNSRNPAVIIAASGMMEAGRIVHHLMHNIENERNLILVIGFQAEHTLGRRIVERQPRVRIMGNDYELNAQVKTINGLSAHADHPELLAYIGAMNRERLKRIFLVHGEPTAATALREGLLGIGFGDVEIPAKHDRFEIP